MTYDPLMRRLLSSVAAGALALAAGTTAHAQLSDGQDPSKSLAGATSGPFTVITPGPASVPANSQSEPQMLDRDQFSDTAQTMERLLSAPSPAGGKAAGVASNTQSSPEVGRLLDESRKLRAARKYADALQVIERALAIEPDNMRLIEERSVVYAGLGRNAEALADNDRLIANEPNRLIPRGIRAILLSNLMRHAEAFEVADDLVKRDPQYAYGYFCRARVLVRMDRATDAMIDLNLALEKDANLIDGLLLRAMLNLKKAGHDAVIVDTSRVVAKDARNIDALVYRGQSYVALAQYQLAIIDFQAALSVNPNLDIAKRGLEVALSRQASAVKTPPIPSPAPTSAPVAPASQTMPPPIVTPATLTKPAPPTAPSSTPQPVTPIAPAPKPAPATASPAAAPSVGVDEKFKNEIVGLINKRMFKEAITALDAELAKAPANPDLIHLRGAVFAAGGDYKLAIAEYDRALKINPRLRPALSDRALAALYLGKNQLTIDYCNQALGLYADAFEVINYRGLAYMALNKNEEALTDFTVLTTSAPKFILGWYNRGRVLAAQKQMDKALADFNQALQIDPRHPFSLGQRGLIFLAKKDLKAAEADFKTALEINRTTSPAQVGMQAIQAARAMEQLGQIRKGG